MALAATIWRCGCFDRAQLTADTCPQQLPLVHQVSRIDYHAMVEIARKPHQTSDIERSHALHPKKSGKKYPPIWRSNTERGLWVMLPYELVLRPHDIHPGFRPRHVWFIMRLMAQPRRDHLGDGRIRATYSQLRNATAREDARNAGRKLRARKGDPSYDSIRRWAADLKKFGLISWVPGGNVAGTESASVFDLSKLADRVEKLRVERQTRQA